jgi:hypothetical protein
LEAPCCNAASSGAPKLTFATTELLLQRNLLQCCNKLQAPELLQSLLARVFVACKEEGLFFFFWALEKKAFFFVAVEEKEEEP